MDAARQELEELRRLDELERKASGGAAPVASPGPLKRTMTVKEQLLTHPLVRGAYGLAEGATALGTGLGAQVAGGLGGAATVASSLLRGKPLDESMVAGADVVRNVGEAATYQPTTAEGQLTTDVVTYLPQKAVEGWKQIGGAAGEALGNRELGETLGGVGMESLMAVAPGPSMLKKARAAATAPKQPTVADIQATYDVERKTPTQLKKAADQTRAEVNRVAKMEAAEAAQRHGIAIDIPDLDPAGKWTRRLVNPERLQQELSKVNEGKAEMALKTAVGIEPETPLTISSIEANLERLSGPKKQIEALDGFLDDGQTVAEVRALVPQRTVGMKTEYARALEKVDTAIKDIQAGTGIGSGQKIIGSIESLRKAARDIFDADDITPEQRNTANIYKGTANALEGLIERRLGETNPQLLDQFRANRQTMAQSYLLKDILDNNTQTVRLDKLAKQTANDEGITGAFSDFGKIYANSPESFKSMPKESQQIRWSRYTIPGAVGAAVLSPVVGPIAGAAAGYFANEGLAGLAARKLASPKAQSRYAEALRKRGGRAELGYEPAPPPLELAPRGPLPPSTGLPGQTVGAGPVEPRGPLGLSMPLDTMPWVGPPEGPVVSRALRAGARDVTPQSPQMPALDFPLAAEMPKQMMAELWDAMQRGDMEAVDAINRRFAQFEQAQQSQVPGPVHNLLYEPFYRRQPGPPAAAGPSAFAEALRNFRGAE